MFIEGQDIARLRNGAVPYLRRKVSVVFQDFRLLPEMTVFENVAFALRVAGYKRKQIDERVLETLELVKMGNYRDRFPYQLSGGEQQRVAIARAIVHKPPGPGSRRADRQSRSGHGRRNGAALGADQCVRHNAADGHAQP